MGDPETPAERGERLYRKSWVSQQPDWYTRPFRTWWFTGFLAVVAAGWMLDARHGAGIELVPWAVYAAVMALASCLQFRSWRRERLNRPRSPEWKRPWM